MLPPCPGKPDIRLETRIPPILTNAGNLRQYRLHAKRGATRSWYRRGYLAILGRYLRETGNPCALLTNPNKSPEPWNARSACNAILFQARGGIIRFAATRRHVASFLESGHAFHRVVHRAMGRRCPGSLDRTLLFHSNVGFRSGPGYLVRRYPSNFNRHAVLLLNAYDFALCCRSNSIPVVAEGPGQKIEGATGV